MKKKNTEIEFDKAVNTCQTIFTAKLKDYGTAWRVLRLPSLTDQIFIKAKRIRSIQVNKTQKIKDNPIDEFIGIVNYAIIALIQIQKGVVEQPDISNEIAEKLFNFQIKKIKELMHNKNADYDEAWREMRISSITDLIIQKLHRIKQIEDNKGKTLISEGIAANYQDIVNYGLFAIIRLA